MASSFGLAGLARKTEKLLIHRNYARGAEHAERSRAVCKSVRAY